ncbi:MULTISPECIES: dethiobiotin synthase [unclassified Inquilinus]|uniref:dethiobiotin synthase n=1 Tax=unclassified Inquilinus TaxID=2645927 RepID=UPI003F918CF9
MSALFVTATGTEIGKTFVTAALARHLRGQGRAVRALKPVVSGFDDSTKGDSDPAMLLRALDRKITDAALAEIAPWRFVAPLSPDMAARREGRTIDFAALVAQGRAAIAAADDDPLLVEGVGGAMVPLTGRETVLDWMAALGIPVLLVAGSYLGTISHTLTTLAVLRGAGLDVRAIVLSETPGSTVPLEETRETIARFAGDVPVFALERRGPEADPAAMAAITAAARI